MNIPIIDPFGVLADAKMPFLAQALDPSLTQSLLAKGCQDWAERPEKIELQGIRVLRYKPGRRCLIEYQLSAPHLPAKSVIILGKIRAKGLDKKCFELMQTLWRGEFGCLNEDGLRVPQPLGVVPPFQMWLQAKVPGAPATALLAEAEGANLSRRIAEGIHKLHRLNLPASRTHRIGDELQILRERLALVAQTRPEWSGRLEKLLAACERLAATTPETVLRGIHRDFYPAQVLVDGRDLYFLDFDLFCQGDPALDVGNFLGHVIEQNLRLLDDPHALRESEIAFKERFLDLSPTVSRSAVEAYTTLTLVRHIYLSTQFPERHRCTEALLKLCEEKLGSP